MTNIIVYSTEICPYCERAKQLLKNKGVTYTELKVDESPALLTEMVERTSRRSVPQIIINDEAIGGFDDLAALDREGKLDKLLKTGEN